MTKSREALTAYTRAMRDRTANQPPLPAIFPDQLAPVVNAALRLAFNSYVSVAVLISQRLIGIKSFQEQAAR